MLVGSQREIWKFELPVMGGEFYVDMPFGAQLLKFGTQGPFQVPCLWAVVDPNARYAKRRLILIGTGMSFGFGMVNAEYVGTIQQKVDIGELVWHLFDLGYRGDAV